jgi:hypothetical protein
MYVECIRKGSFVSLALGVSDWMFVNLIVRRPGRHVQLLRTMEPLRASRSD